MILKFKNSRLTKICKPYADFMELKREFTHASQPKIKTNPQLMIISIRGKVSCRIHSSNIIKRKIPKTCLTIPREQFLN